MLPLARLLDSLEAFHGQQQLEWPTDPYRFLIWWHCGYPASDAVRARVGHLCLLSGNAAELAEALKPGGMVPELRAACLKETTERVQKEFGGDLCGVLRRMSIAKARTALKKFPCLADPASRSHPALRGHRAPARRAIELSARPAPPRTRTHAFAHTFYSNATARKSANAQIQSAKSAPSPITARGQPSPFELSTSGPK
jgi:hypothetical protein